MSLASSHARSTITCPSRSLISSSQSRGWTGWEGSEVRGPAGRHPLSRAIFATVPPVTGVSVPAKLSHFLSHSPL